MAFEWINKRWSPNAKDHINDRKDIICDTEDDVSTLPESSPGSTALVVATGNVYVVNASRQWVEFGTGVVIPTGGGSGGSDTLTWDGNTEGKLCLNGAFYKVSDIVVPFEFFENGGVTVTYSNGETLEYGENIVHDGDLIMLDEVIFVPNDNYNTSNGITIPEKGVYFLYREDGYVSSLTIPGYTGFPKA